AKAVSLSSTWNWDSRALMSSTRSREDRNSRESAEAIGATDFPAVNLYNKSATGFALAAAAVGDAWYSFFAARSWRARAAICWTPGLPGELRGKSCSGQTSQVRSC